MEPFKDTLRCYTSVSTSAEANSPSIFARKTEPCSSSVRSARWWEKIRAFFADLKERSAGEDGFMAIVEVCGMNPWLIDMLHEYRCRELDDTPHA